MNNTTTTTLPDDISNSNGMTAAVLSALTRNTVRALRRRTRARPWQSAESKQAHLDAAEAKRARRRARNVDVLARDAERAFDGFGSDHESGGLHQ